jgi:hypothetical protein
MYENLNKVTAALDTGATSEQHEDLKLLEELRGLEGDSGQVQRTGCEIKTNLRG